MAITVLLFASLQEVVGERVLEVELERDLGGVATVAALRDHVVGRWPAAGAIPFVFAVNRDYARDDHELVDGDEVALVPAISGGANDRFDFSFTHDAIDPRPLEHAARTDRDGAVVTFLGVTRNHHDGKGVERLAYEAYEPMAAAKVLAILEQVGASLDVGRIAVQHRLGEVPIGEASIVVVVAAPHRAAAFDAVRVVMDRIKKEVPIFKKEFFSGEAGSQWVGEVPDV